MSTKVSNCCHVNLVGHISWELIRQKQQIQHCNTCKTKATNLWFCLIGQCQYIGCGESVLDHSSQHAEDARHCLTINLSTLRVWCYECEVEVYPDRNNPQFNIPEKVMKITAFGNSLLRSDSSDSSPRRSLPDESESDLEDETIRPKGLTGLQNLGNTCYMNSALQALSNCPPLTRYFLDCQGYVKPEKNPLLAKSYMKLVSEMWHRKRLSYVVPNSIVSGIKVVHPMFRGYSQQDTQEFLRCFMDELHEELKQTLAEEADSEGKEEYGGEATHTISLGFINPDKQVSMESSSCSSQSDGDYESCDSGLNSEQSSAEQNGSCDELEANDVKIEFSPRSSHSGSPRSHLRRKCNMSGSVDGSSENITAIAKEEKDTLNRSRQWNENCNNVNTNEDSARSDAGEYQDAMSELEPLQRVKKKETVTLTRPTSPTKPLIQNPGGQKRKANHTQYRSVISDIFDGKILSSVQCLTCERVSTTKETFQDLSLPIPSRDHLHMIHASQHTSNTKGGACGEVHQGWISWMFGWMRSWFLGPTITLQDCLAAFFSADELKGDNMYSCEKCKKLRNGIKYSKVLELPEILSIHLKRFRHEFYSSKISTYVSFPMDNLDMKPYLHKDNTSKITTYELIAVICHHGTAGGGHYTAYCLNHTNEQWYEFDDQYVTEVDMNQVLNCEAYVLFYRKQNDHMTSLRQEAMDLMEAKEPSLMQFYVSKQWINKFNTFAEPGPITNTDFLCRHGGVPPHNALNIGDLVQPMSQSMWEFLHERFGGGPACSHLYKCTQCEDELKQLQQRQRSEMEAFIQLNEQFRDEENPSVIYAISMSWFKEWENFVRGKSATPPGPIDNKGISLTKGGQPILKMHSDHGQLSGDMWQFLHEIYGGGPELVIKQNVTLPTQSQSPHQSHVAPSQGQGQTQTLASMATGASKPEKQSSEVERERTQSESSRN